MGLKRFSANARLLCGAATGLAMIAAATPAAAQDTQTDDVAQADENEIVVSGIRASIETSLDAKRESTAIVEVISAEDIGQLPDLSIADSLARLPGVTAQRVRGRSQQISIRGLGPDFSLALLNGREVVSAGNNRGIEFDQFPSELIGQGVVYKTADARLAATGIAGAVDLRTVKPLDFNDMKLNVSARYVLNDQGSLNPDFADDGYRFFGSYIDQNADGTLGWAIAATLQSNPTQFISRELKTNDNRDQNDRSIQNGQVRYDPATGLLYPADNPRQGVVSREFERLSVAGTLQFEPSDRVAITIDGLYSDTKDSGIFRGTETPIASWSGATFVGTQGTGPFADSATYSGVVPILRTDTEGNESEIWAAGINAKFGVTDNLSFVLDYGYSTLDRNDIDYESYAGTGRARSGAQDRLTFTFPDDGAYTIDGLLDYTDPANVLLTDPGGWGQVGFIKQPIIEDELHQLRAEAEWEFDGGFLSSIQVGWLYTDRTKNFDSNESFLRPTTAFGNGLPVPTSAIVGSTDTKDLGNDILAYDPSSFLTDGTYIVEKATFDTQWTVSEKIHNFYVQANIDTMLGDMPLRGNIGLKYADTEQSSTGTIGNGLVNTVTEKFDDWLPNLNLSLEVADGTFFKFAAAKTITRARLDQLAANQSLNTNNSVCTDSNLDQIPDTVTNYSLPNRSCFSLGGGNPALLPYESTAFDLSFEKYISKGSALVIAAFYKDLSNWVVDGAALVNLEQQIINRGFGSILQTNPEVAEGIISGPVNFGTGSIFGVETTLRLDFADLTDSLDGFGGSFSYTLADAEVQDDIGRFTEIPGYSEEVWSADLFYDRDGLQAKVSARYRSGFRSEVQNFDGSLSGADALSETIVDAQIGYTFQEGAGMLEGLGIQFEVFNLTDEPFVTQNDLFSRDGLQQVGTFPSRHELYGRTFNFTIKKSF